MKFTYKDKEFNFPTSLSEITLRQRIDFDKLYAKEIEALENEVYKKDDKGNDLKPQDIDVTMLNIQIAIRNFSFFTGIPVQEVENNIAIDDILMIYYSCFEPIYNQQNVELEDFYVWNEELWYLESPHLNYQSKITFNELIVAKQIVKQMYELGNGNWDVLPYLAAIFLKKENELFDESWLVADSKRVQLMYDLPMDLAIAIGFFLQDLITTYMTISQSLEAEEAEKDQT